MINLIKTNNIIDYAYEIIDDEIIQTYFIVKDNDIIKAKKKHVFYISMYGLIFIQKLEGKGYKEIVGAMLHLAHLHKIIDEG